MALFVQSRALVEPVTTLEIPCSGLGRIEFMGGGQGCFVLYRNTIAPGSGVAERQACGRIYAPLESMPEAIDIMLAALVETGLARATALARRLVPH